MGACGLFLFSTRFFGKFPEHGSGPAHLNILRRWLHLGASKTNPQLPLVLPSPSSPGLSSVPHRIIFGTLRVQQVFTERFRKARPYLSDCRLALYLGWRFTYLCVSPSPREGSLNPRKEPVCFFSCQNTPAPSLLPPLITTLTISGIIGLMAFIEHMLRPRQHGASNEVVLLLSLSYRERNGGSETVTCLRPHSLGARLDQ